MIGLRIMVMFASFLKNILVRDWMHICPMGTGYTPLGKMEIFGREIPVCHWQLELSYKTTFSLANSAVLSAISLVY